MTEYTEEKITAILEDQKRSAQLLVRRDRELSQANERLREIDRVKSEFISIAAHQLRTPLSAIKWSQQMLYDEELGPLAIEQKQVISQTQQSVTRLVRLVNNLLDVDHLEIGKGQYEQTDVDLIATIQNIFDELRPRITEKTIDISLRVDRDIPKLRANQERLRDVFYNLIDNAVKYTPVGGKISIELTPVNGVTISIRDTGIGIPEVHKTKLFTRFARAENAKRVDADGSGLGLYIVKKIIEINNGTISVESTEGVGTTFILNFPNVSV